MPIIKIVPMPGPQGAQGEDGTGGSGLNGVKTINWQYPTEGATAIQNSIDGEAISLKSSNSAALRWHVRDGGYSTAGWSIETTGINSQSGEMNVGPYQVQFAVAELDFTPPTGYYYNVNANGSPWDGPYICTASTTTTITLEYPGPTLPGANEEFTGGNINPPSIYNQVEADEDGVWIKNADWSSGPDGYVNYWHFANDGKFRLPGNGYIYNLDNSSGDGLNNAVISIVPDSTLETDQYLVIDPTTPNHIHIRAGGDIDASTAELILGGEDTHVTVSDQARSVNILADTINIDSYVAPSSLNINTYSGAIINSNRTSTYSPEDKVVATLGDLPTGATGTFVSQDGKTVTVTNGIITGIE